MHQHICPYAATMHMPGSRPAAACLPPPLAGAGVSSANMQFVQIHEVD